MKSVERLVIVPLKELNSSIFGTTIMNENSIEEEQIEVRECLLSFGAESFVFQFAIQKYKF